MSIGVNTSTITDVTCKNKTILTKNITNLPKSTRIKKNLRSWILYPHKNYKRYNLTKKHSPLIMLERRRTTVVVKSQCNWRPKQTSNSMYNESWWLVSNRWRHLLDLSSLA